MNFEAIVYGILFIVPCVLFFISPTDFLKFGNKWRYKNAEPTDTAIIIGRIVSVVGIIIGIILIAAGIMWDSIQPVLIVS